MTKLGKIAIVGAAVGAGVYLAQKCMPKMSVFFAHEDDDDTDVADETEDVKEDKKRILLMAAMAATVIYVRFMQFRYQKLQRM